MSKIIAFHSFRGGTGKSNITANVAAALAQKGLRVGVVDTDIQSPGIHVLFGLGDHIRKALNHYLWGEATINEIAYAMHELADEKRSFLKKDKLWLIPSSIHSSDISRILQEGYNVSRLNQGFHSLMVSLNLDYLLIDTHPGINEETLLSIAIAAGFMIIMRPDQQDFQGTAVTVDIAQQLEVPNIRLIVNKALTRMDSQALQVELEKTYQVPVAAILPLTEEVAFNASHNLFSCLYPEQLWSQGIQKIANSILEFGGTEPKPGKMEHS
jgi:MinD-like ATPase involved in chromosome partitioning or flagellar assembly